MTHSATAVIDAFLEGFGRGATPVDSDPTRDERDATVASALVYFEGPDPAAELTFEEFDIATGFGPDEPLGYDDLADLEFPIF